MTLTLAPFLSRLTLGRRSGFDVANSNGPESGRMIKGDLPYDSLKTILLKENSLFSIDSLVFNIEKSKQQKVNNFNCFYSPNHEAICIMIEKDIKYLNLTKEIIMSLMDFARKMEVKNMLLLINRGNSDYGKFKFLTF